MKRFGILSFLISILLLIIFHKAGLVFIANCSIRAYSVSKWGKPLEYEKLYLSEGRIIIQKPKLESGFSFSANQMMVDFHLNLLKRILHIDIQFDKPHWHLESLRRSQWEKWDKVLKHEEKWIKTHRSFHIDSGLITWASEESSKDYQINFDLKANSQEGGFIKLFLDNGCLLLQGKSGDNGMEVNCLCEKVGCPSLFMIGKFLGVTIPSWLVTSGSLNGQMKAIFSQARRPHLEGEIFIEDLAFNHINIPLKGGIQQACLKLEKNPIDYELKNQTPTIFGRLDILKPAFLSFDSPFQQLLINHIEGSIRLDNIEMVAMNLKAEVGEVQSPSLWNLQGKAHLNSKQLLNLDLTLFCSSLGCPDGKVHLSLLQPQKDNKRAEVEISHLFYRECDFLRMLIASYYPLFNEIKLEQGELNAIVEAQITNNSIDELEIKSFDVSNLTSTLKPWHTKCHFNHVFGEGKFYLKNDDVWSSTCAALNLEDGELQFDGIVPLVPLKGIQAHLNIHNGLIEHSAITMQVAGLKGVMDVEWGEQKQLLTIKMDGMVNDLGDVFPQSIKEALTKNFDHNHLMILANVKRKNQQVELGGSVHIQRENIDQYDLIHFGCELKKMSGEPSQRLVPEGWFYGHNLPLEKFLTPFIFRNKILRMSGEGEFKGSFDDQFLTINYDADHLVLENDDLCITADKLHSSTPGQLIGSHEINLQNYTHHGTLPIQHATYHEKNSGLFFQDIQGIVKFENQILNIQPIEAYCKGVYFAGELSLDYRDPAPGVFDLKICCPTLSGKISQIQTLLKNLERTSFLNEIPLQGEMTAKEEGLKLEFNFVKKGYSLRADIQGMISDGAIAFKDFDMALNDLSMDFAYCHQKNEFEFSDIQGALLVGKPRIVEEYLFTGNYIRLYPLGKPNIELDIAVIDKENELLRFVGHTEEEKGYQRIFIDKNLSHLSCIYPGVWQCRLKDWSQIEQLEFCSQFNLGTFFEDIQRFRQTGLLFLSHRMIDKLAQFMPIEGNGFFALQYHPDRMYTFQIEGTHITKENSHEHFGLLKGVKQDKKWIIEQLQWDDLNLYAELQQDPEKWKIPFLGMNIGKALLLGLEGDLKANEGILCADLKFCEINLATTDRFEFLRSFMTKWWPKGRVKATGHFEWNYFSPFPLENFKAQLLADVQELNFRDYPLKIVNPVRINIQGNQSFQIEDVKLELYPQNGQAFIDLKTFEYNPSHESFRNLKLDFLVPNNQLEKLGQSLHHHFPEIFDTAFKEVIVDLKKEGQLKGALAFENSAIKNCLKIQFDDGIYHFKKREYYLKEFEVQILPNELRFSALSIEEKCHFQIFGETLWPTCQQGQIQLVERNLSENNTKPLTIKWENRPQKGWMIKSIEGEFCGGTFFLGEEKDPLLNTNHFSVLQGRAIFDFNNLKPLLTDKMAQNIEDLKLNSPFTFIGNFWINPEFGNQFLDSFSFKGCVASKETVLKGYQIQNLHADVQCVPGRLDIQNLSIQDPAGSIRIASLIAQLDPNKDLWTLFIPRLTVKNFKPYLLRNVDSSDDNQKIRSLLIKRIDFQNFSGEVSNQQTWKAEGHLHFLNPSRKNLFHPLLAIPAEIILRLGLDPHVLNPVTGTIYFNLQGDRFYFTRFKDVYSEGRGSKFYLAQGPNPSWMDFVGNISIQVRMKQYNLIFKIAELFTVSIQGNVKKPRYTLNKQVKTMHKGHALSFLSKRKKTYD